MCLCKVRESLVQLESGCSLHVVDTYDLVDPADKRGDFDVDAWNVSSAATEAPRDETAQLVIAFVLAD